MQPPPNDLPHRALRNFLVSDSFSLHGWAIIDHFDSVHDCGLGYRQLGGTARNGDSAHPKQMFAYATISNFGHLPSYGRPSASAR